MTSGAGEKKCVALVPLGLTGWRPISVDAPSGESEPADESAQSSDAAQTVARIAASVPAEPAFSAQVQNPTSFDEIYQAAEIQTPPSGYTIEKAGPSSRWPACCRASTCTGCRRK